MNVLLCPLSDPGYLYPAIDIGLELRRRRAVVYVLGRERVAPLVSEEGFPFLAAEDYGVERTSFMAGCWLRKIPAQYEAIRRAARDVHADVLVTSILCHGALLAAEVLDLPVVVVGFAAHIWAYQDANGEPPQPAARVARTREMTRDFEKIREEVGLPGRSPRAHCNPLIGSALFLRSVPELEFPGAVLPERVHHVGPCRWEPASPPAELAEITDHLDRVGKPVAYVHLGRIFRGTSPWPWLNAAFTDGPFQAIVELGRTHEDPEPAHGADLLVVRKPWMGPLIDRSEFVLTSGTSAPVLNALARGRSLGISPVGSENMVLGSACVRAGVGLYIPSTLSQAPQSVLRSAWRHTSFRIRAEKLGRRLVMTDGGARAADIIERTVTGLPVTTADRRVPTAATGLAAAVMG
jgi:UDP:flavonoid glycosyltransferase YjiC (YdhE family)